MAHMPEQILRLKKFIAKAEAEGQLPESYFARCRYNMSLEFWNVLRI